MVWPVVQVMLIGYRPVRISAEFWGAAMNILVLGGGGREHALVWAVKQNPKCDRILAAPGNAGIAALADCFAVDPCDAAAVIALCRAENVDFVIVGPEAPLVVGISDLLRAAGFRVFGPSKAASQLEASKSFTKEICSAASVPTAAAATFTNEAEALAYLRAQGAPIVVKADGLAAGKGVTVATTLAEAEGAVTDAFAGRFGEAGALVVIEEYMEGEEASLFVLCDGTNALPIGTAQDHKRAFDGETGPNTGGMGAYSPAPVLSSAVEEAAMAKIVRPTLAQMSARGAAYQGVLYAGLMIADAQPRLVEYNVRFGDPEMQVLALRLGAQLLDLMIATTDGRLDQMRVNWADDHALAVVMAAGGYPGRYAKGMPISGLVEAGSDPEVEVFHAGTVLASGSVVTNGGRVLNVAARGGTLAEAKAHAYGAVEKIDWQDAIYRRDIGWRAL